MTQSHSFRLALLLAAGLVTLLLALSLPSSPASASPYCGGQQSNQFSTCFGASRTLTGVTGHGDQTSICIGFNEVSGGCSGGPGQIKSFNSGSTAYRTPWIRGNATTLTTVWAETF